MTTPSPASIFGALRDELTGLADSWERQSVEVRTLAEEDSNPILAAHRIGRCDTFEDAAAQLRNRLRRATTSSAFHREFVGLSDQWIALAEWAREVALGEVNRLTRAYRDGTAEAYDDAAAKVKHALENAKITT